MTTDSDFWGDLNRALVTIVGDTEGRSVVVNPSSGVVLVRALPTELRNVDKYLRATQLVAERQVMLEAKIIDVTLSEDFQAGVNWGAFNESWNSHTAIGTVAPGTTLTTSVNNAVGGGAAALGNTELGILPGEAGGIAAALLGKGFIGLALQTSNFAALLNFLETQGSVSVLSSPRIATLNNQKAVLKVGTDRMFVTNLTLGVPATTYNRRNGPELDPAAVLFRDFARRNATDRRRRQHHFARASGDQYCRR
jgi:MSHA biogenesis protein MshL